MGGTRSRCFTSETTRTPHTSCIAAPKVKSQPEDGPDIGPKHAVVVLVHY